MDQASCPFSTVKVIMDEADEFVETCHLKVYVRPQDFETADPTKKLRWDIIDKTDLYSTVNQWLWMSGSMTASTMAHFQMTKKDVKVFELPHLSGA
jgi:hypothetical protein